jgi:phosphoribosylformylglycinamidine synthase
MRLINLLVAGRTSQIFSAAHDLSQGGLSATLTEMVLRHNIGAVVEIENPGITLISESPGRVVVAVEPAKAAALTSLAGQEKIAITKIGTTGGTSLVINGADISLTELGKAHSETFPKLFG